MLENLVNTFYIPVYIYQLWNNGNRLPKHQSTPFLNNGAAAQARPRFV